MKENIILVDCDGVLCNWEYAFTHFMEHTKQIKTQNYNEYNVGKRFGVTKEQGSKYVEEFNDLFSEFDNIGKAKMSSEMHNFHIYSDQNKNDSSVFEILNKTVEKTKQHIDNQINNYVKDNLV